MACVVDMSSDTFKFSWCIPETNLQVVSNSGFLFDEVSFKKTEQQIRKQIRLNMAVIKLKDEMKRDEERGK